MLGNDILERESLFIETLKRSKPFPTNTHSGFPACDFHFSTHPVARFS